MGEPIRKTAAREDILRDFKKTHDNAVAREGTAAILADQRLVPISKILESFRLQQDEAHAIAAPLLAALTAAHLRASRAVGKVSDDIWNDVGRPASDAAFDLLFPGGNAFYMGCDATEQPDRLDLLVELLKANVHPKLSPAMAQASIMAITAESAALRVAADGARQARARLQLLDRVLTAVARSAAIEIGNFKRLLKANGFSEADAHTIIPDRGHAAPKKEAAAPAPAPAASVTSPPPQG
jgi:hypothetical protein